MADLNILLSILRNVVDNQSELSSTSPNSTLKNQNDCLTNTQPNTYLYLCGHKLETIAIKGNPVDQSSFQRTDS